MLARTKVVLVVDDDHDLRWLVALIVGEDGYQVREAGDGLAALRQVEATRPDLILLDARLPFLSGVEVAEALHARGIWTPIVAMTVMLDGAEHAAAMGAVACLRKPFDLADLTAVVQGVLQT